MDIPISDYSFVHVSETNNFHAKNSSIEMHKGGNGYRYKPFEFGIRKVKGLGHCF